MSRTSVKIRKGGTARSKIVFTRTGTPPTVTSISTDLGDTAGGTALTITGTDFLAGATVSIGGVAATSVVVVGPTSITCVTGARAKGTVDVVVTNTSGLSGTLASCFEYFNPTSISTCVLWLRGDLGLTLDGGGNVSTWADQSGVGSGKDAVYTTNTCPRSASNASYNNKATVGPFYDGANRHDLKTSAWNTTYSTYTLGFIGDAGNAGNRYVTYESATQYNALLNSGGASRVYATDSTPTIGGVVDISAAKSFVMSEFNGASSKLFENSMSTAAGTTDFGSPVIGTAGTYIGGYPGAGNQAGTIAEVFCFSSVLTAGEKARFRKYLNGRYSTSITA